MKLILKQYLASLRERGELDVVLPDLLSQLGLNVFSRPSRGPRQNGVDVGAVGAIAGGAKKVYLFTIKPGNISRQSWADTSMTALRPSIQDIVDAYVPSRLPHEHKSKDVVICVCCGGEVQEDVRESLRGYFDREQRRTGISFEEWDGDRLAGLIASCFLRENVMPERLKSLLRKAIAILDEPVAAHGHFAELLAALSSVNANDEKAAVTAVRQMSICLWVVYSWCRDAGNLESAYLSAELSVLHAWHVARQFERKKTRAAKSVWQSFDAICDTYQRICSDFIGKVVTPRAAQLHGLSSAIHSASRIDINLKLFDLLGRVAMDGLWALWAARVADANKDNAHKKACLEEAALRADSIIKMVRNNPALYLPIMDDQGIDVMLAALLLATVGNRTVELRSWLGEMQGRIAFAFDSFGDYPSTIRNYADLLSRNKDEAFREEKTAGSILISAIAFWMALFEWEDLYDRLSSFVASRLRHCNVQYWYPDELTEQHLYSNSDLHGMTLSHLPIDGPPGELLAQLFKECDETPHYKNLSACRHGMYPLVLIAARRHRLPVPLGVIRVVKTDESTSPPEDDPKRSEHSVRSKARTRPKKGQPGADSTAASASRPRRRSNRSKISS